MEQVFFQTLFQMKYKVQTDVSNGLLIGGEDNKGLAAVLEMPDVFKRELDQNPEVNQCWEQHNVKNLITSSCF